ncbi:MAG: diphosphomevalonate decarboxylase [Caeruleum heppii]|nr:MAG: diphosphomevalonate decarboxylase [Caeruleum heppii]
MAEQPIYRASTTAPVNIAVIKYWGKRSTALNLPTNSSLSVTLSQADLRTHTTASCSPSYPSSERDTLLLNSSPQDISSPRTKACLTLLRALRASHETQNPTLPKLSTFPLRLVSENNFPTAAGLASSAAGFAALVRAIADLYELPSSPVELSRIARQGSGSACRSLMGGYVAWRMGEKDDGSDSQAEQIAPAAHWPAMRALILVVSAEKKGVSSTTGMQTTVSTSSLFPTRAREIVPQRMRDMENAIHSKNFESFATITMRESNSFHATCLDTEPPIFYLNDVSRAAIRVVEDLNTALKRKVAAYTFDAGPNAVIYYLEEDGAVVEGLFRECLGRAEGWKTENGRGKGDVDLASQQIDEKALQGLRDGVARVIQTGVGEGPRRTMEHLVDEKGMSVRG